MNGKIIGYSNRPVVGPGDTLTLPKASEILSLVEALKGRTVDPGTAELVAQLAARLRTAAEPPRARKAEIELRHGDEFHEGFAQQLEELSAQIKREGDATLSIAYVPGHLGPTMSIRLAGPPATVESIEREISDLARGAVNLSWA